MDFMLACILWRRRWRQRHRTFFFFAAIAKIVVNGILAWHTKYSNYDVWERTARARMSHSSRNDDKLCLAWPVHALCNCRYCGMCAYLASDIFDFDCCQCLSLLRFGVGRVATEPTRQRLGSDMFEGRTRIPAKVHHIPKPPILYESSRKFPAGPKPIAIFAFDHHKYISSKWHRF